MYWTIKTVATVVVLATLSISHYYVYNKGVQVVNAEWTKDKLVVSKANADALEQALKKTEQLQVAKQKVDQQYVQEKRKAIASANGAQLELNRLRNELNTATAVNENNNGSSTSTGVNGGTRLEQELLGHCAATLVGMAAEADRLETVIVGLQRYVTNVCLTK